MFLGIGPTPYGIFLFILPIFGVSAMGRYAALEFTFKSAYDWEGQLVTRTAAIQSTKLKVENCICTCCDCGGTHTVTHTPLPNSYLF